MVTYMFGQDSKKRKKGLKASSTRRTFRFKSSHRSGIDLHEPPPGAKPGKAATEPKK